MLTVCLLAAANADSNVFGYICLCVQSHVSLCICVFVLFVL